MTKRKGAKERPKRKLQRFGGEGETETEGVGLLKGHCSEETLGWTDKAT